MRVIICGAGQVGYNIAAYLSRESNDITIIDHDPVTIADINNDLDVNAILGHASSPDMLSAAGASECDMIIAVTHSDEVNMVACQVAHSLFSVPKKIARIRDTSYLDPAWANLFSRAHMPIDVIISPEIEVAHAISQRLSVPGTTDIVPMAAGKIMLCSVICEKNCPVVNTPLRQLTSLFPDMQVNIVGILRNGEGIIPNADDQMLIGDEVYFIVSADHLDRVLIGFGHEEQKARHIVIMGGGNIGRCLIEQLKNNHADISIKMIENNPDKAHEISKAFEDIVILQGNGLDRNLLQEANITQVETFVAVTDDDETNILGSLLARQYGCDRAITLVNKNTYNSLMGNLGIGAIVSPRAITVSSIMQYVRRGRIKDVHNIHDGFAEVIEAELSESSHIINMPLQDIPFPHDVVVGAIVRDGIVIMPRPETMMRAGDHVIVLAGRSVVQKVEKMFSVQVNLF